MDLYQYQYPVEVNNKDVTAANNIILVTFIVDFGQVFFY